MDINTDKTIFLFVWKLFFAPESLLYKGNFDYMAKNYGGEIAEHSFEDHEGMKNVWKVLANTGTPIQRILYTAKLIRI